MLGFATIAEIALAEVPGTGVAPPPIPPFIPPRRHLSGKIFTIDAVQNYFFGPNPFLNESCVLLLYVGGGLPLAGGQLFFTFVRPDGSLHVGDSRYAFIGDVPVVRQTIGNFPAFEYVIYQFDINELNQLGTWRVSFFIPANYRSQSFTFTVTASV